MTKKPSRKSAREAAHALRQKSEWDTRKFVAKDPLEKLRELDAAERPERVYKETEACDSCMEQREVSGDETALCQTHLAQAMGLE